MKKNNTSYIFFLILFLVVKTSSAFCQTQCITAVASNNAKEFYFIDGKPFPVKPFVSLTDSGSAIGQNFTPACNGSLTSFSFCYRALQSNVTNNGVIFPKNSRGNPIFNVDLNIYELSAGQSLLSINNVSLFKNICSQPNIEMPIPINNPREDFQYITLPITQSIPLSASKQYCFIIQLTTAFCNNLMAQKAAKMVANPNDYAYQMKQKNICTIDFSIRQIVSPNSYIKSIDNDPMLSTITDDMLTMNWKNISDDNDYSIAFAVNINPNLDDIQGNNIVCNGSTITLNHTNKTGSWSIDNTNIATIVTNDDKSVTVTGKSAGLVNIIYTVGTNVTTKLIRVVEIEKPVVTPSKTNLDACQDNTFTLTGMAVNNQALQLDGNSFVEIPDHPALKLTNKLTLEVWVYCTDPTAPQYIISKGNDDQEMGHYGLTLFNGFIEFWIQHFPGMILKSKFDATSAWHHVAGTYDGDTMRLYIDGVQVNTLPTKVSMIPNTGNMYIGQLGKRNTFESGTYQNPTHSYAYLYRMRGQIDEVRIWNVCRTAKDIFNNMYKTVYANNTGLVGYYKFNEPSSAAPLLIRDYSGSHNDGKLYSCSSGITYNILPNCTAQKIPASIKFGDFSYAWSNGSSKPTFTPANSDSYTYTVTDTATGCSATSDATIVKMNGYATVNKIIPTSTAMPYTYNENNINLTFEAADFISNVATKTFISSLTDGNCPKITTVTVTKADCPSGKRIEDYGRAATDLSNVLICNELPYQLEIKGYVDNTMGSIANNPSWDAAPSDAIYNLSPSRGATRVEFQNLQITKPGNATLTYRYKYNNNVNCVLTSNITVIPVSIAITSPIQLQTGAAFTAVPTGGTWSSTNTAIATVDNSNGTLTRKTAGDVDIQYKVTRIDNKVCYEPIVKVISIKLQ